MTNRKRDGTKHSLQNTKAPFLLVLPAMVVITAVLILPIFYAIYLSFTNANLLKLSSAQWIGFENYITFFTSNSVGKVFGATFIYVIVGVFLVYFIGLGAALLLNMPLKGKSVFRGIMILPWAIPQVVLVLIWKWMLNPQYGIINHFLQSLGLVGENFSWFTDPNFAMIAIMLVTLWKEYPLSCLILFAGLKTISPDQYEAASIDGAGKFKQFIHITMPGLKYVTSVLVLLLTIWSFTNFVIIWLLTMGGPSDKTATLSIYTYLNAFKFNKLGQGAAIGTVCLLVSMIFSVLYYKACIEEKD